MSQPGFDLLADPTADFLRARRAAVAQHASLVGLDQVEITASAPGSWQLALHFLPAAAGREGKHAVLATVGPAQIELRLGAELATPYLLVSSVSQPAGPPPAPRLDLTVVQPAAAAVGPAVLTLRVNGLPALDPFFACVPFSLQPAAPAASDCQSAAVASAPAAAPAEAAISYLGRDFLSFRRFLLDRLAVNMPSWQEENPADPWVAVLEVLADAADRVSYFEDAVATEAYLGTARRRISVRRHARLAGYRLEEGANARTWVRVTAVADGATLPAGSQLLSRLPGLPAVLAPGSAELDLARARGPLVFETLHALDLVVAHNVLPLYDWGAPTYALAAGATEAVLDGSFLDLSAGDVLVLAEVAGPQSGLAADADPAHRHAVRLTEVALGSDPLASGGPRPLTLVRWHPEDALPFTLCLAAPVGSATVRGLALAWGNVVLADHGETIAAEALGTVADGTPFRPTLVRSGLAFVRPYDDAAARATSATAALAASSTAVPALALDDGTASWQPREDLLASGPTSRDFVVEMDDERRARLRFGDGSNGLAPAAGSTFAARYRVGGGCAGNLGRGGLRHVVAAGAAVGGAENPLPAVGGSEPEELASARQLAPQALTGGGRCVSVAEFACRAEEHAAVARAAADLRFNGSWHLLTVAVERRDGAALPPAFTAELAAFLEADRLAGWELAVVPVSYVGLDIAFAVVVEPAAFRGVVERDLLAALGPEGFFAPGRLRFGEAVYLGPLVAAAQAVPGVRAVELDPAPGGRARFQRWGEPPRGELSRGEISLGGLEVARLDNDAARPERGRLTLYLEGGR